MNRAAIKFLRIKVFLTNLNANFKKALRSVKKFLEIGKNQNDQIQNSVNTEKGEKTVDIERFFLLIMRCGK